MKYFIGIDIGGMSIKCGLVNQSGQILKWDSIVTIPQQDYTLTVKDICDLINKVVGDFGITLDDVSAVGMGIPGTVDAKRGVITYCNNINFRNTPIVEEMKKHLSLPVFIGNDANLAALGEVKFGSAKGEADVVFVTLGTGVGTGIIVDGKMIIGRNGAGAEGGHIVIKKGGLQCSCGQKGCWEAYASATALQKMAAKELEKHPESLIAGLAKKEGKVSGKAVFDAAKMGDRLAKRLVKRYTENVSSGLVSLVNIFRPSCIIIGGGISNAGDGFFKPIQDYVSKNSYGRETCPRVEVRSATLKNDAGILGGVALAMDSLGL